MNQGVRLCLLYFFGTDFTDYTDFLALEGHSSAFRLHAEVFEKREITGRNITVMVRRIDTCQGLKSQLPKRPQFFRRYVGYSGRFFQGFWVCFFWHGFHGLHGFFSFCLLGSYRPFSGKAFGSLTFPPFIEVENFDFNPSHSILSSSMIYPEGNLSGLSLQLH